MTRRLAEELEYIGGPPGTIKSCNPHQRAVEIAMDAGCISRATVYIWKKDFCDNGFRFLESLVGKSIHESILDNPIMNEQAKAWL